MKIIFISLILIALGATAQDNVPTQKPLPILPSLVAKAEVEAPVTPFKNVRKLGHLTESELERLMGFIAETLDVKCNFCHNPKDYSLDEKPTKLKARKMIGMVQELNRDFFKEDRISCFTCHQGGDHAPPKLPEGIEEIPSLLPGDTPAKPDPNLLNLQKLKHLQESQIEKVMESVVESLGVKRCTFCHNRRDFSLDEIPVKRRAREMFGMVQKLNREVFQAERIACFTCHRGTLKPARLPENWR